MMVQGASRLLQHLLCILSSSSTSSSASSLSSASTSASASASALTSALLTLASALSLISCSIEPPLHLPAQNVSIDRQAVEIEVELIWENPYWEYEFLYNWEALDVATYGPADYEDPADFELRSYFLGENPDAAHTRVNASVMYGNYYRSLFNYGYHDILVWSNIHTPDNTQSVIIDETPASIDASVTRNNSANALSMALQEKLTASMATIHNMPEIFYSAYLRNLHITANPDDYDYYDEVNKCWVKKAKMPGAPLVFIYLIQVVIRNNEGKITGVNTGAALAGITDQTNVNTGQTSLSNTSLLFDLNMKKGKIVTEGYVKPHHSGFQSACKPGEVVDILGGRITTYGLCGQKGYVQEKSSLYTGSCPENQNLVAIDFEFKNGRDSVITFDLTPQLQRTCHGGVLTIELDASKITIPVNPNAPASGGSGFDPYIENYTDSIVHEFDM